MRLKSKTNRFIVACVAVCHIVASFSSVSVFAEKDADTKYKSTDFVITYARDGQSNESKETSWDRNIPFPGPDFSKTNEAVNTNVLNDGSASHPAEAYRALNEISGGIVTIDFDFSMDKSMDTAYRLLDDKTTLFGIVTQNNGIYLEQPNNKKLYLCPYATSYVTGEYTYVVKAVIDFDKQKILSVQINGKTYAKDKPYANNVIKANGFNISTSKESVGVLTNRRLFITGGYHIFESFWNSNGNLPDDWTTDSTGGSLSLKTASLRFPDKFSLLFDSSGGASSIKKDISPLDGNLIFEINTYQTKKRTGFYIDINGNGRNAASITSDGNSFCYVDKNGALVPFYSYVDNVWYKLKLDIDTENNTYDIYLNNKLKISKIELDNISRIDNITIKAEQNQSDFVIDDILLYRKPIYSDYVEPPKTVEKADDDTLLCMQMCPLWTEGTHYGWDPIKAASNDREPLLGFYDEANPEVYDWTIKWMLEHGVDFQFQCIYPAAKISHDIIQNEPLKPDMLREHNAIINGFMNAKYSNQMKFAVIIECATFFHGNKHYEEFFKYYLPFYIEYYFKDDRYMKINGRPVIGVFALNSFLNIFDDGTGEESIKRGIQEFRKVLIEAGVGDPYLLSNDSTSSNIIKMAKNAGFDGITAYGLGGSAPFSTQRTNMISTIEVCQKEGIDFWPIATPVRDDIAWRVFTGYSHTGEEFEEYLKWMQNDLMKTISSKLGKKVINLTTWDEYGEGHIIAPTVGKGFQYLDAIRNVFTKSSKDHEDAKPTDNQKKRMTASYVQDRKIAESRIADSGGVFDPRITWDGREYDTPKSIPNDVKKGFYFKDFKDSAKWYGAENVASVVNSNGVSVVTANGATPTIVLNEPLDMDAYDVTYVKLRMKKNPTSGGGWLSWTSDVLPNESAEQKLYFSPQTNQGDEALDYYIPVGKSAFWKGKIKKIKLILGDVWDYSKPFEIESIEFLQDKSITNSDKISIDGWIQGSKQPIQLKEGAVMVPLRHTMYSVGAKYIRYYQLTDTYSVKYGEDYAEITLGKNEAYIGDKKISLPTGAYKNSATVNDEVFVPLEFVEAILSDKNVVWDEKNKTLSIVSVATEGGVAGVERVLVDSIVFDSANSFASSYGLSNTVFEDGKMSAITTSGDPQMMLDIEFNSNDVKMIEIKINTTSPQAMNFFFITDKDQAWNEFKRTNSVLSQEGDNIIRIDTLKQAGNWTDTIKKMRFDPAEKTGQMFTLEYIKFYGNEIETNVKEKDMSSCVYQGDNGIEWKFSKNSYLDGWQGNKSLGSVEALDGALNAVIIGKSPALINRGDIGAECEKISNILIKYANKTMSKKLKVYFATEDMQTLSEDHSFTIDVAPMKNDFAEYVIDTSKNENWRGKLVKLVIVPSENMMGSLSIDKIELRYR